jgi:hypothetical protein
MNYNELFYQDAERMGYWARNTCGSTYFFSNILASSQYFCFRKPKEWIFDLFDINRARGIRTSKHAATWE